MVREIIKVTITGASGSIGRALLDHFDWNPAYSVDAWDPRAQHKPFGFRSDALILCHGGDKDPTTAGMFDSNALSVGSILHRIDELVKRDGIVIVFTSRRSICPTIEEWDYSAAKAAARAYSMALYKSHPQLRVTTIAPGWVESDMAKEAGISNPIPIAELARLVEVLVVNQGMRIPEIVLEPIGDNQLGY